MVEGVQFLENTLQPTVYDGKYRLMGSTFGGNFHTWRMYPPVKHKKTLENLRKKGWWTLLRVRQPNLAPSRSHSKKQYVSSVKNPKGDQTVKYFMTK